MPAAHLLLIDHRVCVYALDSFSRFDVLREACAKARCWLLIDAYAAMMKEHFTLRLHEAISCA